MAINQNNVKFAQDAIDRILGTTSTTVNGATALQEGIHNGDTTSAAIAGADTINAAIKLFKQLHPFVDISISGTAAFNTIVNNWDTSSTSEKAFAIFDLSTAIGYNALRFFPATALAANALSVGFAMYSLATDGGNPETVQKVNNILATTGQVTRGADSASLYNSADKNQTPAEKIQQINNPIIIKESQAGNPIDQFTFDTATQALSPWKNGNIVDLNDQGELFVNDPDVAFSDIGDLFDAEEAMLQELQEGLITYEEFSAFQDYVLDYSLDDYVFEPNYNFDEYAYDPIGAFYDSQSEEYDNALSIASHTGVLLDANNQALSIAQLQALDTNNDGQLSTNETTSLNLWTDLNEDGHLNTGELVNLSTLNQPIQQSDYGFYTQGNGLVATNQPNQANQATEPTTPDSNYRHLRDTINFIGTYDGVISWGADDIKIDEGRTHMLIGTDGNDAFDVNYFSSYTRYFSLNALTHFLAGDGNDLMGGSDRADNLWGGKDDGLLVFDKNNNGKIDDGSELFGNNTVLSNGNKAANGFEALKALDSNNDGKVDSQDANFSNLKIWQDKNSDGKLDKGELLSLSEAGVQSLNTTCTNSNEVDSSNNAHKQQGSFTTTDGTSNKMNDVWFDVDLVNLKKVA